jgi:hypothetical protein
MEMNGYSILQELDTFYHHQMNLLKMQTASLFKSISVMHNSLDTVQQSIKENSNDKTPAMTFLRFVQNFFYLLH